MNHTEFRVWCRLRDRRLEGFKFRRQHPIGPYVVDFYCPRARLIVEVDGPGHEWTEAYDLRRAAWLEAEGFRVMRFWTGAIDADLDSCIETILGELSDQLSPHPPGLALRAGAPSP